MTAFVLGAFFSLCGLVALRYGKAFLFSVSLQTKRHQGVRCRLQSDRWVVAGVPENGTAEVADR